MASKITQKDGRPRPMAKDSTLLAHDEEDDRFSGIDSDQDSMELDAEPEKDATEQELEKLVFGDAAGFRQELQSFKESEDSSVIPRVDEREQDGQPLTDVADADLFSLDTGPSQPPDSALVASQDYSQEDDDYVRGRGPPVWEDSDDERMRVSLMSVPRLRKLRKLEGEDVISGKEYIRRLRRQYEMLHPRPEWAQESSISQARSRKRRRRDHDEDVSSSEGEGSHPKGSTDSDDSPSRRAPTSKSLAALLRSSSSFVRNPNASHHPGRTPRLKPEVISLERMKDLSPTQPHAITSISVHPSLPLLLSSGVSSTLYLHQIKPTPVAPDPANPLLTSLHIKNTPYTSTSFSPLPKPVSEQVQEVGGLGHPRVYAAGPRRYFHMWSLPTSHLTKTTRLSLDQDTSHPHGIASLKPSPCGRYVGLQGTARRGGGVINILDARTLQWIVQAKAEGVSAGTGKQGLADFCWWRNGDGLCIVGRDGEVAEWSMNERRCVGRWMDEGQVGAICAALGGLAKEASDLKRKIGFKIGDDRYVVVGSSSGIVNLYDRGVWSSSGNGLPPSRPRPMRVVENLVTPITNLAFSPDGQLLAMASRGKRDALKLLHTSSGGTVYQNWPTGNTPLGRVSAIALGEIKTDEDEGSRRKTVLFVGNEAGSLRGWLING